MDPVLTFEFEATVTVSADLITQQIQKISLHRCGSLEPRFFKLDGFYNCPNPKTDRVAAYVSKFIIPLIERSSIQTITELDIAYASLHDETSQTVSEEIVVVAYDVIRCADQPIVPAFVDKVKRVTDTHIINELDTIIDLWRTSVSAGSSSNAKSAAAFQKPKFLEDAGRVRHKISIQEFKKETVDKIVTINLRIIDKVSVFRVLPAEFAKVLFVPRFPDPDEFPKHALALAAVPTLSANAWRLSASVWKNLSALNRATTGSGRKTVLILGEPGSGKEIYAQAMHYGSINSRPDAFVMRSVANLDEKTLSKDLFGEVVNNGHHIPGLIEKATGGSLCLDEFDKVHADASGIYGALLRVLEAGEYTPINGKNISKVRDVNWIFAGAFSSTRKIEDLPPDIWSRFTHDIKIESPINERSRGYIAALFLYWCFGESFNRAACDAKRLIEEESYNMRALRRVLFGSSTAIKREETVRPSKDLIKFALHFENNAGEYTLLQHHDGLASGGTKGRPQPVCKAIFVKNRLLEPDAASAFSWEYGEKLLENATVNAGASAFFSKLNPVVTTPQLVAYSRFDGIRSIRQATKAAFHSLIESSERSAGDFSLFEATALSLCASEALVAAVQTLDIARAGKRVPIEQKIGALKYP